MTDKTPDEDPPWWHADNENPSDQPGAAAADAIGTAAAEAVKLANALSEWAKATGISDTVRGMAQQAAGSFGVGEPGSGVDCKFCPICQGVVALRGVQPEAADNLTQALDAMTTALRNLVEGMAEPPPPPARFEHINLE